MTLDDRLNGDFYDSRETLRFKLRPLTTMTVFDLWGIERRSFTQPLRRALAERTFTFRLGEAIGLRTSPPGMERIVNYEVVKELRSFNQSMQDLWGTLNSECH